DDRNRVQELAERETSRTICWIPASLTTERLAELGKLAIIDKLLEGQRFDTHAGHLNPDDRRRAHTTLTNHRSALLAKMRGVLRQAYGLAQKQPDDVRAGYDDHLLSLTRALKPTLPIGASFAETLRSLADQMLSRQYPAHPDFDPDRKGEIVRPADVKMVLDYIRRAVESPNGRVDVDRPHRQTMRRIANPLRLGQMHEAAFVVGGHWVQHFHRKAAEEGIQGELRVTDLLRWIDTPDPHGLDPLVAQLVIAAFAEQTDRTFYRYGSELTPQPEPDRIPTDSTLREHRLPEEADWDLARQRAGALWGFQPLALRRGRVVAMFSRDVTARAAQHRPAARRLVDELERHADQLGLDPAAATGRLATARAAATLLDELTADRTPVEIVERLARAHLPGPADRVGKSISSAEKVSAALASADWANFARLELHGGRYTTEAAEILRTLRDAAREDELTTQLAPALHAADRAASALLDRVLAETSPQPVSGGRPENRQHGDLHPTPKPTVTPNGSRSVAATHIEQVMSQLRDFAKEHPDATIEVTWRVLR
ncbi:MAG TPA: hypothetical protein VF174_07260, partial [Micromonosporaceae bacterium]